MTKKHFIALAEMIKAHNDTNTIVNQFGVYQRVALAGFLQQQFPQFNEERWMDYINGECGPNGGEVKL